jgi:hypothetical protein
VIGGIRVYLRTFSQRRDIPYCFDRSDNRVVINIRLISGRFNAGTINKCQYMIVVTPIMLVKCQDEKATSRLSFEWCIELLQLELGSRL